MSFTPVLVAVESVREFLTREGRPLEVILERNSRCLLTLNAETRAVDVERALMSSAGGGRVSITWRLPTRLQPRPRQLEANPMRPSPRQTRGHPYWGSRGRGAKSFLRGPANRLTATPTPSCSEDKTSAESSVVSDRLMALASTGDKVLRVLDGPSKVETVTAPTSPEAKTSANAVELSCDPPKITDEVIKGRTKPELRELFEDLFGENVDSSLWDRD